MWSILPKMQPILLEIGIETETTIKIENNRKLVTRIESSGNNGNVLNRNIKLGKVRNTAGMLGR
jgi:hypothetical protein